LVSPDGVVPCQMVGVSASVNLLLHGKVQKFSSGTGSPGWSRKKGRKAIVIPTYEFPLVVNSNSYGHKYIQPFQRYAYST